MDDEYDAGRKDVINFLFTLTELAIIAVLLVFAIRLTY
jgi:hypothetical protein